MEKEDVPLCTDNSQSPLPLPAPEDKKKTLKNKQNPKTDSLRTQNPKTDSLPPEDTEEP